MENEINRIAIEIIKGNQSLCSISDENDERRKYTIAFTDGVICMTSRILSFLKEQKESEVTHG